MKSQSFFLLFFFSLAVNQNSFSFTKDFNVAEQYRKGENHLQAVHYYYNALQTNPDHFESQFYYATELFQLRHYEDAATAFEQLITSHPSCAQAHFNYGLLLHQTGKLNAAIQQYEQTLHCQPDYPKAQLNCAQLYEQHGNIDKALHFYNLIEEKTFDIYITLGNLYQKKENHEDALINFVKAATICPKDHIHNLANTLLNLGNTFFRMHHPEHALQAFNAIVLLSQNFAAVYHNIGFTLAEQCGNFQDAIEAYKKALQLQSHATETTFCLSLSFLSFGNFEEGWPAYETRWKRIKNNDKRPRAFNYPLTKQWDGWNLNGKRILIRAEQGLGDTLQFIRYAQLLKKQGAFVIAEIQKVLIPLFSACDYLDELVPVGSKLPYFDYQIPLMTLPLIFKTTLETIPAYIEYLYPDPTLVSFWKKQLAHDPNFKIGICWYGDSAHGQHKFMPLHYFSQLASLDNVSLYSLQKMNGLEQLEKLPNKHCICQFDTDFDQSHGPFMDTAATMKNLDLVITVDTSIAHLAGALGIPVWIVLPFPAEWRWLTNRNDSPWYPTMRLFRQQNYEDWEPVIKKIITELPDYIHLKEKPLH